MMHTHTEQTEEEEIEKQTKTTPSINYDGSQLRKEINLTIEEIGLGSDSELGSEANKKGFWSCLRITN